MLTIMHNGKAENEMTKDEIINAICADFNIATNGSDNENLRIALDRIFSAGWRCGEKYANEIHKIERSAELKKERSNYENQ